MTILILDSLKTYYKSGELDEDFHYKNGLFDGLSYKFNKKGEKKLTIDFERILDSLKIIIDDNGIGRQKSAELNAIKNKDHLSFATEAMQNRIALLNQYKQKNIAINFEDKFNKNAQSLGTKVIIEIPITY